MDYLYHYTTVDTLKLILENKTFRFKSLENMDDSEEAETEDYGNLGRFCYVSCWTENSNESIPMWNQYTEPEKGVRLRFPTDIFETVNDIGLSEEQMVQLNIPVELFKKSNPLQYTKGLAEIEREDKVKFMPQTVKLAPITYTKDTELLHPKVHSVHGTNISIENKLIGKFKHIDWEFQKEWRYQLFTQPIGIFTLIKNTMHGIPFNSNEFLNSIGNNPIEYEYFDIPFKEETLKGLEIVMSPIISQESKDQLNDILKTIPEHTLLPSRQKWR